MGSVLGLAVPIVAGARQIATRTPREVSLAVSVWGIGRGREKGAGPSVFITA